MSPEPEKVSVEVCKQSLGSLSGCLVDGDAEQLARERRTRRRALAISIFFQTAVLAALILMPLFGKAERITFKVVTPMVPYGHPSDHPRGKARATTSRPINPDRHFTFHPPTNNVNRHPVEGENPTASLDEFDPNGIAGKDGLDCSGCVDIGGRETGPRPPQPPVEHPTRPQLIHTQLNPAMLIRRVEPVYPSLA